MMKTPIVLSAFGTTSRALDTYAFMDGIVREKFPDHDIRWAYTSRIVRHRLKGDSAAKVKHPSTVLDELFEQGYPWAVVQSMHLTWGHEFYRLVGDADQSDIRTSMGLPLLTAYDDYLKVSRALSLEISSDPQQATVLVGHGTDHPAWTSYLALDTILKNEYGPGIHVGVVDKEPSKDLLIEKLARSGVRQVSLIPLMLVAGVHVAEDLNGDEDSWKNAFNERDIAVTVTEKGVGYNPKIVDIFVDHIQQALDLIPGSDQ
ncbi:CbiK2 [Desulforapulum autotrophicum HRM2]|uniref:CbiK2 n=1 Tax=Desulforapulum autotrophicum (strain ATCC 43914 / DSM 3382 / VKM B-1955 / HRM2) TaxID=177437 RepID=C0QJN1_DESAH|nr:sirohydrochlorin cobaltochelatase [Desulforapulum autotrophicum]ACN13884.1 CbiK2 [Desulforapulum autotrophicum HRM2]